MNQRIRELIAQCTTKTSDMVYDGEDSYIETVKYFDKELFAELIVRECAGLVQGVPTDTMGYHTADQKIKDHFGVEE